MSSLTSSTDVRDDTNQIMMYWYQRTDSPHISRWGKRPVGGCEACLWLNPSIAESSKTSTPSKYMDRSPPRCKPPLLPSGDIKPRDASVLAFSSQEQLPSRRNRRASSSTVYISNIRSVGWEHGTDRGQQIIIKSMFMRQMYFPWIVWCRYTK